MYTNMNERIVKKADMREACDMKRRVIVWRINQICNMRCRFCSYSRDVERIRSNADDEEVKRLCGVLADHKDITGEDMLISWIGGEPLLWEEMMPRSRFLHERGIEVSATTNGLLLGKEGMQEGILANFSELVCSLDGYPPVNDAVRQYPGHFEKVTGYIRELNKKRKKTGSPLRLKVNTILMRKNFDQFRPFCEYLLNLGVDEVTFNQLGGYDRPEFYEDNRLTVEQAERLCGEFPAMQRDFAERGLVLHGSPAYLRRILLSSGNCKNPVADCRPGGWFWFINENGFISPCSYTSYEYAFPVKHLKRPEDIPKVQDFFEESRKKMLSRWCGDCHCTQVYDKFA